MKKLRKTELTLLTLISNDPNYATFHCKDHGVFATRSGSPECPNCHKEQTPLNVAESINQKIPVYALPAKV